MPSGVRWRDDSAAFASNWRTIVAVDVLMGAVVLAAGLVLAVTASGWWWFLGTVGVVQLFFAFGRVVKWRRLRREAGLG